MAAAFEQIPLFPPLLKGGGGGILAKGGEGGFRLVMASMNGIDVLTNLWVRPRVLEPSPLRGQASVSRGSRASRNPSPAKLKLRTVTVIMIPG
jgi:hypothetical protein